MTDVELFLDALSKLLDQRKDHLTRVRRVVTGARGTVLHATTIAMAVPAAYATWEGYVKDAGASYLDFLNRQKVPHRHLNRGLLFHAWARRIRHLRKSGGVRMFAAFADDVERDLTAPMYLSAEQQDVDTGSNLYFDVVERIALSLGLDASPLQPEAKKIDSLVFRRNELAHGGQAGRLTEEEVLSDISSVGRWMGEFEAMVFAAIEERRYLIPAARVQGGQAAGA